MPTILSKNPLAHTRVFNIEGLEILYPNQTRVQFERLVSAAEGAVLIVPLIGDDLILIREYAAGVGRYELGFAKGKIDPGESWREAAEREAQEEIGYRPKKLTQLDTVTLAAGYMSHHTHIVLAEDLVPDTAVGDEPEPLEVVTWPLKDWPKLMAHPEFSEGRAYAALLRLLHHRQPNQGILDFSE